ncbi:DUF6037 family protein [Planococcus glaciei]|uniref:Uncharacterized protein n=1 Tax=Planococcus glaciei TaxID=459472 RepID=A0A7H8QBQ6_9BACL|nr:DUF6037 family protein [Planococcus glaciei]MBX0316069.1 hypothetical protein [Planococcus glaciei]QKX51456.1 hypothetical protein HF394_13200 [Planococcus glaciei]
MKVFENLKSLKSDMENKGWRIDSFLFTYKQQEFIVLVKLYSETARKPDYALLELEFLKKDNFTDNLIVPANSVKLFIDAKTLRTYFNIEYGENLGIILQQFNGFLATFIPTYKKEQKSGLEKKAISHSLSRSDGDDPEKIYCFAVKRNRVKADGTYGERSPFNDNKARLWRKDVYDKLDCRNEKHISFCFSKNPEEEKTDEEIIYNWTSNRKVE